MIREFFTRCFYKLQCLGPGALSLLKSWYLILTNKSNSMKHSDYPTFTEVQNLKIPAMRIILGVATAVVLSSFFLELYRDSWSQETLLMGLPTLLVMGLFWWLIEGSRIYTRITPEGIGYRFKPLQFRERFARWEDLKEIYLREYSALGEFGGWGLRYGFGLGWGYVAGGDCGVQLVYKSGKKRFISTQRFRELKAYLEQHTPAACIDASHRSDDDAL